MPKKEQYKDIVKREKTLTVSNTSSGKNYLLVIGIDDYAHCPTLFNAVKDAQAIVKILQDRYRFEAIHTTTLYDKAASKANIYNAFRAIKRKVTSKDNLLIYFSGHGEYDKDFDEGYWIPVEAEVTATHQYIANSEIKNILSAIPAHHTFLMADSCFSGSLFAKGRGKDISLRKERDPSRWGLTAGRNEIVTDGKPGDNSPFAKSILYQLQHADQPIGVAALCDKVLEVVSANANQIPRGEPLKVDGHQGGQFVFHLKQNEAADWSLAKQNDTLNGYESFLKQYPNGSFSKEAEIKITTIKAKQVWTKVNTLEEESNAQLRTKIRRIHKYLTDFPNANNIQEAENKGEYLHYKQEFLDVHNNLFALRKFARQKTPFQDKAVKRMAELEADLHKEEQEVNRIKKEQEKIIQHKEQERLKKETKEQEVKRQQKIAYKKEQEVALRRKQEQERREKEFKEKFDKERKREEVQEDQSPPSPSFLAQYGRYLPLLLFIPLIWGISQYMENNKQEETSQTIITPNNETDRIEPKEKIPPLILSHKWGENLLIATIQGGKPPYSIQLRKGNTQKYGNDNIRQEGAHKIKIFDAYRKKSGKHTLIVKDSEGNEDSKTLNIDPISTINNKDSGTFKDSRDGQTYKWIRLKDGKKWMAQNLNYKMNDSWCYDDKDSNCREYGRLYNWATAKKSCPNGWRLPSDDDWWKMASYYGKAYNSHSGQQENNSGNAGKGAYKVLIKGGSSGFSALLVGNRNSDGDYDYLGDGGSYWSSKESDSSSAWIYLFSRDNNQRLYHGSGTKSSGNSCRCVQD